MKGLWKLGLKKPLFVKSLMSSCGNLEDNAANNEVMEAVLVKSQRGV